MTMKCFGVKLATTIIFMSDIPLPPTFQFDDDGLVKGMVYKYRSDGSIDWRAMLLPEHFGVHARRFKDELLTKYGKSAEQLNPSEIEDKYLLIFLAGFRYLARLRGALSIRPKVVVSTPTFVSVRTMITWRPNPETGGLEVEYGDCANASSENTTPMVRHSLDAIAANKAFVRAVRGYLEIPILGWDEVTSDDKGGSIESGPSVQGLGSLGPSGALERIATDARVSFEQVKKGALTKYRSEMESDPEKWTNFKDVPPHDCMALIAFINAKK